MTGRRPSKLKRRARLRAFLQWMALPVSIGLMVSGHLGWGLALAAFVSLVMGYGILSPTTGLFGAVVRDLEEADGSKEGVWLTIDDGPDAETTPKLLDLLDREQAVATFFLIGSRAASNPELVREMVRRGHEIGNHTQTHPAGHFWILGGRKMWREISSCQQALANLAGVTPRWFRAPVGHYNLQTHPVTETLGLRVASWNCRGFDAVRKNVPKILSSIEQDLKPGAIVLLHDVTPVCAEVLAGTLQMLKDRGLKTRLPEPVESPR